MTGVQTCALPICLTDTEITVKVLGGEILCEWDQTENIVYMTGPAETVFDGEIALREEM